MASFGYTLRKAWRKKRDDIRQAKYTHEHDVLFRRKGKEKRQADLQRPRGAFLERGKHLLRGIHGRAV